ncbi:MAG: metallophosphoesterase [Brevundimonas sp.]|uniref:metallophosphoesterase n=1 Tax=Brevundimonas sp. TaxID=1871086 RepID=UPI001A2DD662|nr:metallophosphoesterase [Brevundimonas sp.]MBJ7446241.1 metallophosphoesterase [Brevundimonas sp.]
MSYDIIGDIHGHADQLISLLQTLGYQHRGGAWRHPSRSVIFVGDFVDRGPGQLRTLEMVRDMVEAGSARAVMGNHEFNAIAWATPHPAQEGAYLRSRAGPVGEKNRHQHQAFLAEVAADGADHQRWVAWFLELPLWIEEPEFRVVHACWSPQHADHLRPLLREGERLSVDLVQAASQRGSPEYEAVETLLKGAEVELPDGHSFTDKDGHHRTAIRIRWWDPTPTTYRAAYIGPAGVDMPDLPLPTSERRPAPDRPTFIGHYWFDPLGPLAPVTHRVACVDFSVAKGGPLVAYRYDGEPELSAAKFVAVDVGAEVRRT